jgi:tetratricopeptide (TPR) repeat protein
LRQKLPPGHIAFAVLALEQGLDEQARGDLSGAIMHVDESLTMMEALASRGREPTDYEGKALVNRSGIALQLGRGEEARADASRALPLLEKSCLPGSYSADVGHAYLALGQALRAQGRFDEAHAAFQSAAAHLADSLGPDHPDAQAARKLAGGGPNSF